MTENGSDRRSLTFWYSCDTLAMTHLVLFEIECGPVYWSGLPVERGVHLLQPNTGTF